MSKWRPSPNKNIYAIGDIHGNYHCLDRILCRILPLKPCDELIFLGDYVDRGIQNYSVIEKLADISKQHPGITCLYGNHEWLFTHSVGIHKSITPVGPETVWLQNGGVNTIVSYAKASGLSEKEAMSVPLHRIADFIPEKHKEFLMGLYSYYETDDYIFVHAGCDTNIPLDDQPNDILLWDRSLWNTMKANPNKAMPWKKRIVCGHNYEGLFVHPQYLMIDMSGQGKVACVELTSNTVCIASPGKDRVVVKKL